MLTHSFSFHPLKNQNQDTEEATAAGTAEGGTATEGAAAATAEVEGEFFVLFSRCS